MAAAVNHGMAGTLTAFEGYLTGTPPEPEAKPAGPPIRKRETPGDLPPWLTDPEQ